jgi:hypothetical protein
LSLHFSDFSLIFYGFSKFELKLQHYLRFSFANRPLELLKVHTYAPGSHKRPWKDIRLCNWVLRGGRRRSGRNSGGSSTFLVGEVAGDDHKLVGDRFIAEVGSETVPESLRGRAQRWGPRMPLLQRKVGATGAKSGSGSSSSV